VQFRPHPSGSDAGRQRVAVFSGPQSYMGFRRPGGIMRGVAVTAVRGSLRVGGRGAW